jgi:carbon monoxide dehydrogenase subunit G
LELAQRVRIPVAQSIVWSALNDPVILKNCLLGCQSFDRTGENSFEVMLVAKVGPVKATFNGAVTLNDVKPPESYRISGSGKGGVAGFARGGAEVYLESIDNSAETLMSYQVTASVGGKLAQVGSRLVTGAARKMANDFFTGFVRSLSGDPLMEVEIETLVLEKGGLGKNAGTQEHRA